MDTGIDKKFLNIMTYRWDLLIVYFNIVYYPKQNNITVIFRGRYKIISYRKLLKFRKRLCKKLVYNPWQNVSDHRKQCS